MAKIRLDIDPVDKILLKRNLNKNGAGQKFFTHEVRRLSTPYVPRLSGNLSMDSVTETASSIIYDTPYARRQYYENKGKIGLNMLVPVATGQNGCGWIAGKKLCSLLRNIVEVRRNEHNKPSGGVYCRMSISAGVSGDVPCCECRYVGGRCDCIQY